MPACAEPVPIICHEERFHTKRVNGKQQLLQFEIDDCDCELAVEMTSERATPFCVGIDDCRTVRLRNSRWDESGRKRAAKRILLSQSSPGTEGPQGAVSAQDVGSCISNH